MHKSLIINHNSSMEPFSVRGLDIFWDLLRHSRTGWPMWLCIIFCAIFLAFGIMMKDTRFLIVGVMFWLTIVPVTCFFLYYYYLFSEDMLANILPHTMERNRDGYTLWMYKKLVLRDSDDDGAEKTKWMVCGRISVMDASVIKTRKCFNYTVLYLEDAPMSVLYVPTNDLLEQNYENT